MIAQCIEEITTLHAFFESWFNGTQPDGPEGLTRVDRALAPEFTMVTPDARVVPKPALMEKLQQGYGRRPNGRIWIENMRGRALGDGLTLMLYEEWQQGTNTPRGRLSSALFRTDASAPSGVSWVHLHEGWLPDA